MVGVSVWVGVSVGVLGVAVTVGVVVAVRRVSVGVSSESSGSLRRGVGRSECRGLQLAYWSVFRVAVAVSVGV